MNNNRRWTCFSSVMSCDLRSMSPRFTISRRLGNPMTTGLLSVFPVLCVRAAWPTYRDTALDTIPSVVIQASETVQQCGVTYVQKQVAYVDLTFTIYHHLQLNRPVRPTLSICNCHHISNEYIQLCINYRLRQSPLEEIPSIRCRSCVTSETGLTAACQCRHMLPRLSRRVLCCAAST